MSGSIESLRHAAQRQYSGYQMACALDTEAYLLCWVLKGTLFGISCVHRAFSCVLLLEGQTNNVAILAAIHGLGKHRFATNACLQSRREVNHCERPRSAPEG